MKEKLIFAFCVGSLITIMILLIFEPSKPLPCEQKDRNDQYADKGEGNDATEDRIEHGRPKVVWVE